MNSSKFDVRPRSGKVVVRAAITLDPRKLEHAIAIKLLEHARAQGKMSALLCSCIEVAVRRGMGPVLRLLEVDVDEQTCDEGCHKVAL